MPVFICEACNETLKRNKVATHHCPGCWYLSCMDCGKRFAGDEYLSHTTCVSEAERYQGALYVHKDNKGEVKQQAWLSNVQTRLDAADGSSKLQPFMERLLAYDNVPRKRAKFINFAKNSLNLKQDRDGIAEKLWDVIGAPSDTSTAVAGAAQGSAEKHASEQAAGAPVAEKTAPAELAVSDKIEAEETKADEASAEISDAKEAKAAAKAEKRAAKEAKAAAKAEKRAASKGSASTADANRVPYIADVAAFEVALAAASKKRLAIDFTATWCGPCQVIGPRFVAMAQEFPNMTFAKVDVDSAEDVAERCGITSMPTFQIYQGHRRVAELCDATEDALRSFLMHHSDDGAESSSTTHGMDRTKRQLEPATGIAPGGGKRQKGEPQPVVDTATKPIKWKKIIAHELKSCGGQMRLKALRKACVAEALAHPSHGGRDRETLHEDFDRVLPSLHKFHVEDNKVTLTKGAKDD